MIKSRRTLKFYLHIILSLLIIVFIDYLFLFNTILSLNEFLLLQFVYFCIWCYYIVYKTKQIPIIIVKDSVVIFKSVLSKKVYAKELIANIYIKRITGEWSLKTRDNIVLDIVDGSKRYIYNEYYSNFDEIRTEIEKIEPRSAAEINYDKALCFKGSFLFSFWGLIFFEFLAMIVKSIHTDIGSGEALIVFLIIIPFTVAFNFYVVVKKDKIVIKNHLFPFSIDSFLFDDIMHVAFTFKYRGPYFIKIYNKQIKRFSFYCNTLSYKDWAELEDALVARSVRVRNELKEPIIN